jgi:tetratricopeptide (TPR) repeat protein
MNVANPVRVVRVFVSSPIDVAPERGRAQAVAAKLNREYEGLVKFETVLWEERFYKADRSFQPQIPESVACDIVVSIFWTRIGTEQPADFPRMPDGRPYPSGTAYELLTALEASKSKGVPDVYVFRKTADAPMPTADAERRRQAQAQLDALEAFWSEWFKAEKGQFKAAFQSFASTDGFEQQLEGLLRQWLETHGLLGPRLAWPKENGSPFRGLAPFEAEHAAVFFGRSRVIDEARHRLNAAAERATPFLLIVGASGAGKSSLARAGLIPRLTTPGLVTSVDAWRVARMKPSEGGAGPLTALATALFAADALPELTQGDYPTPAALADNLARGGEASAQPIMRVLARVAEEVQRERHTEQVLQSALVLLVDQLEELFAQGASNQERTAFARCIKQLVGTGQVWCVATLRADLYEFLLKQPALKALKEAGASLDLGPPGAAELAEIVRAPAAAAGLIFERDADKGELDERLLADAKTADSLPLLQFTLRQLYEHRVEADGKVKLTHGAYDALGRLEGAIAAEAEQAVAKLPPTNLEALPRLVRLLAEPARDSKALTLREVPRADVAVDSGEAALVDALLRARILIARRDAEGRPTVRLAHDAVLASWPRAKDAAQASHDFYRVRAEIEDALQRWQEHNRPRDRLIQPGVPLAEAEKLVQDFGRELPAEINGYVSASRNRARARQRAVAAAAVFFFALSVAATWAGVMAYRAQQNAVRAERDATAQRTRAENSLRTATETANKLVIEFAQKLRNRPGMPIDLVRDILDRAQGLQQQLLTAGETSPELRFSAAQGLNELVLTLLEQGASSAQADTAAALTAAEHYQAIMAGLVASSPDNAEWQYQLSLSHNRVGDVLDVAGRYKDALANFETALAIRLKLATREPGNILWQDALATSYSKIGDALRKLGRRMEALDGYDTSLNIRIRIAAGDPQDPRWPQWQRDLAVSFERKGIALDQLGALEEALEAFTKSLEIRQKLAAKQDNARVSRDLSVSYERVGDALAKMGKSEQALAAYHASFAIRLTLVNEDPTNSQRQRDLAVAYGRIGEMMLTLDRSEQAVEEFRPAFAIIKKLAAEDPGNVLWQTDLVIALRRLARAGDEPRTHLEQALAIARQLDGEGKLGAEQAGWIKELEAELRALMP